MPQVLGVGSAIDGATVEVRDAASGRLVESGWAAHAEHHAAQQHPELWWDAMVDAIASAQVRRPIAAMAVAAQRQALVLLDGAGAPLTGASLRGDDRAAASAAALARKVGPAKFARGTGQVPGSETPLARLAWLVAAQPRLAGRIDAVLGATELLTFRLTGRRVADAGSASGTGWWDPSTRRWRADLLDRVAQPAPERGWRPTLAEIVGPAEGADRVSATVHGLVGLPGRPVVAAGTDDLMARALAAAVPVGATAALLDHDPVVVRLRDAPVIDPTGTACSFADATGRHLPTVATLAVGVVLDGVARLLGTDAHGLAAAAAEADPARAGAGPVLLGFRAGGPGGRPRHRPGVVLGLGPDDGPADLAAAALRGVAAELLDAADALGDGGEGDGGQLDGDLPFVLAGELAHWPGLAQAVADLRGSPVVVGPAARPATGAAVVAAATLERADPLEVAAAWGLDEGIEFEPDPEVDGAAVRAHIRAMTPSDPGGRQSRKDNEIA